MIALKQPTEPRRLPTNVSPAVLLDWIRNVAPDFRLVHSETADGRQGVAARFTFGGEVLEVEAIAGTDVQDPYDAAVRRCAWLLWRRTGLQSAMPEGERRTLEKAILDAAASGNDAEADRLGRELAMKNEAFSHRPMIRTRFENFGPQVHGRR